jgi:hypothetical protein
MKRHSRILAATTLTGAALCAAAFVAPVAASTGYAELALASIGHPKADDNTVNFDLVASTPAIAACLPYARAEVTVDLTTAEVGFDRFEIEASGLVPNQEYTVFLLEQPGNPFGAAEYIGDFSTNGKGKGRGKFRLIVEEAFASTIVNGNRVRADLNHVGFWFADPAGDDQCFADGGPVTPFDGDNEAGAQVMNSSNALPGAPLPLP